MLGVCCVGLLYPRNCPGGGLDVPQDLPGGGVVGDRTFLTEVWPQNLLGGPKTCLGEVYWVKRPT